MEKELIRKYGPNCFRRYQPSGTLSEEERPAVPPPWGEQGTHTETPGIHPSAVTETSSGHSSLIAWLSVYYIKQTVKGLRNNND